MITINEDEHKPYIEKFCKFILAKGYKTGYRQQLKRSIDIKYPNGITLTAEVVFDLLDPYHKGKERVILTVKPSDELDYSFEDNGNFLKRYESIVTKYSKRLPNFSSSGAVGIGYNDCIIGDVNPRSNDDLMKSFKVGEEFLSNFRREMASSGGRKRV